jgi:cAMP-dependent protein kinase regulator
MASHSFPGGGSNPFGGFADSFGGNNNQVSSIIEEEENDGPSSHFKTSAPFGGDASKENGPPSAFNPGSQGFPANYGMGRRTSVSAESMNPNDAANDNWKPPHNPKSPEQLSRLKEAIGSHTLFKTLDEEQSRLIMGALVEKQIPAKNIKVSYLHLQPTFNQEQQS